MKSIFSFSLTLIMFVVLSISHLKASQRTYNFNSDWKVYVGNIDRAIEENFDDSKWKSVTLPYAWNEDEAFKNDIREHSVDIAWYRKEFVLPVNSENKNVFLEFEGFRQAAELYINGNYIGNHENGVMAAGFDISASVKPYPEKNIIAVRTDNDWEYREKFYNQKYQWADRNFNANYGGIPKNAYLHVTNKVYQTLPLFSNLGTTGTYVYASEFDIPNKKATINVEAEVKNDNRTAKVANLNIVLEDLEGKEVAIFKGVARTISPNGISILEASQEVKNLEFWSWGYGYLYNVKSQLEVDRKVVDEVNIKTGFRKTEYKDGMVYLNDRVIQLKGYAQRTSNEWPSLGLSVPAWLSDYSNQLMVESNGNFVRWMHVTPWKQDIESCDRVGLIQIMPAGDAEHDVVGRRWEQRVELMRDAIIYNRNNPSILFYEGGNKGIRESHMQELLDLKTKYDPYGGRAMGSREMFDSDIAEWGGEMLYINKSAGKPLFATEYSRDEGHRKYWDDYTPPYHKNGEGGTYSKNVNGSKITDASPYNHNQDSHALENIARWYDYWHERPGTGTRVSSGGANIIFSDTNTHYRGAENYRRSGEVDAMRIPKENFWAHQVMWAGWVDLEEILTHIIGHWNYEKDVVKDVYVVSGAEKVELFINEKSKGFGKQSNRFQFTFENVKFEKGTIKAVGYDENGTVISTAEKKTAGEPASLKLTSITSPVGFKADGADVALVQVEVVDKDGNRCPTALNMIDFDLSGPAEWRGGIAIGEDNFILSQNLPVEGGVNRVLIRSTKKAGKVKLKAKSEGLKSASISLKTKKHITENGLSKEMPYSGLPAYLEKGRTPEGPSYTDSRIAHMPANVIAGSNQETAHHTIDDNERTSWTNDDKLSNAWIQYQFDEEKLFDEIAIKFPSHRTRSYPLAILVNDKEVYNDNTERNLGYYSIKFKPAKGDVITIQLKGASEYHDSFGLVEITGQKDEATIKDQVEDKKATLNILEVEFYENLK
mgnify:CR=1 FL=1